MTKTTTKRPAHPARPDRDLIPARWQHPAAIFVMLVTLVVFFWPVVGGEKTFLSSDTIASHSWDTLLKDAKEQGIFPLWNPYIFCGMPGYASLSFGGDRFFDLSATVLSSASVVFKVAMLNAPVGWVLFFYLVFGSGMYLLVFSKVGSKTAALAAGLAAMFSTYVAVWIMIGHNTKIAVIAFFPFILWAIERLRERFDWRLALGLVLLLHFSFIPSHVQMIFYMYFALGVYFLYFLVRSFAAKEDWRGVVRAGVVLVVASALAFAMDADKYLSVWEYNSYSIRGSAPLVQEQGESAKTQSGGLGYEYATSWSLGPGEMMTFILPSWYGFGPLTYEGRLTAQPYRGNFYIGPQPFVDGAQYMGIVVLVLAGIGFWRRRRDPFVQAAGLIIALSLLIAFGKEFSLVYDLMFKYFPMFNKFRVPLMILILVQIFIPILAAFGLASLLADAEAGLPARTAHRLKITVAVLAALGLLGLVGRGVIEGFYTSFMPFTAEIGQKLMMDLQTRLPVEVQKEFYQFIASTVGNEFAVACFLLAAVVGFLWLAARHSLALSTAAAAIVVLIVADLWRIDARAMHPNDRTQQEQIFATPEYVKFLQRDPGPYRILQLINGQLQYDNTLAYWRIQNAYGYQGAKIRAFQDVVEVVGLGNPLVMQLMNVKYIVANRPDSLLAPHLVYDGPDMKVYRNPTAAPRAFFVNRAEVAQPVDILHKMSGFAFDPKDVAFFLEDPKLAVDPPQASASVEYTHLGIQDLSVNVTATGNNLLFLSEAWYPKGWKAFIDGAEVPIHRLDYLFRGVVVPKGTHKLEMRFEPSSFSVGKNLSLAANILVLGGLGYGAVEWWRKRRKNV